MITLREALTRIATAHPETRAHIVPLLRKHAQCACGDEMVAEDGDELMGGRKWDKAPGKGYGSPSPTTPDPKWDPKPKGKCYYETGDEADRCYVTTNGGPGGQTKPDTGSASNKKEYNKKYRKQRYDL